MQYSDKLRICVRNVLSAAVLVLMSTLSSPPVNAQNASVDTPQPDVYLPLVSNDAPAIEEERDAGAEGTVQAAFVAITPINLARGQLATQSSTDYGGAPGRAVDGNAVGSNYVNGSVTATANQSQPWWQVDLKNTYTLSNIRIWNRADCCAERLSNFYVFVSKTDMRGRSLQSLRDDSAVWEAYRGPAVAANGNVNIPAAVAGRFVRIQKADTGVLSLAEVQVYGANLAQGRASAQSSTYSGNNVAGRAVDGDADGVFDISVASTNFQSEPWWQVDLGQRVSIGRIKLFNRTDCCRERLAHFYVFVSDSDMGSRSVASLANDPSVWKSFEVAAVGNSYIVTGNPTGRYVRIQRNTSGFLSISEVVVNGAPASEVSSQQPNPAIYGQWSGVYEWPHIAVHAGLTPNGEVLTYDATPDDFTPVHDPHTSPNNTTRATIWNPATNQHRDAANDNGNDLFCSGHTTLASGDYFAAGGTTGYNQEIHATNIYDFRANSWLEGPTMAYPRWYPTASNLGNGDVIIAGGRGPLAEVYNPATNSLRTLGNVPQLNTFWPFIMQSPNGRIIVAGGENQTSISFLDTTGQGSLTSSAYGAVNRSNGSFVVYGTGSMMVSGGSGGLATADVIDMNTGAIQATSRMNLPRFDHNTIALPDGSVLAVGGSQTTGLCGGDDATSYAPEQWNPATGEWQLLAAQQHPRQYHSTALLLPDGRVWSGGQGYATNVSTQQARCSYQNNAEIFSPPYLFNSDGTLATRPTIGSAPNAVQHGTSFVVETPDAGSLRSVAFVRLGTATHATNFSQRYVPLSYQVVDGNQISVSAPANANIAPDGYYMLFLVNSSGVPSVAEMVQVRTGIGSRIVPNQQEYVGFASDGSKFWGLRNDITDWKIIGFNSDGSWDGGPAITLSPTINVNPVDQLYRGLAYHNGTFYGLRQDPDRWRIIGFGLDGSWNGTSIALSPANVTPSTQAYRGLAYDGTTFYGLRSDEDSWNVIGFGQSGAWNGADYPLTPANVTPKSQHYLGLSFDGSAFHGLRADIDAWSVIGFNSDGSWNSTEFTLSPR